MAKPYTALPLIPDEAQTYTILHPEWLGVYDSQTRVEFFGARQAWYPDRYQRAHGCGVVTAALATAYSAHKPHHVSLFQPYQEAARIEGHVPSGYTFEKQQFLGHMQDLWRFMSSPPWGVTRARFTNGIKKFAKARGINLSTQALNVNLFRKRSRRNFKRLVRFVGSGLKNDMPVAMLLHTAGQVKEVMGQHWVTIVKITPNADLTQAEVTVSDHGKQKTFSLDKWFYTARLGGCLVSYQLEGPGRQS